LLSFVENTDGSRTSPADGSGVTAWPIAFIQNPQDGFYPTGSSPAASGTTSGGACTLTGLTAGDAYWICIVDEGTKPHWFQVNTAAVGSGTTLPFTYAPVPRGGTPAFRALCVSDRRGRDCNARGTHPGARLHAPRVEDDAGSPAAGSSAARDAKDGP